MRDTDDIAGENRTVLTDVERGIWLEEFRLSGAPKLCSLTKRTLRGGLSDGVDFIEVDNGALHFAVLPTRGMGLWKAEYQGLDLGWRSPVRGPVHPKFVEQSGSGGAGWLAGFDELVCRCGLESNGAPCLDEVPNALGGRRQVQLTLHGRIANTPACRVEVAFADGELAVYGMVEEASLFGPALRLETVISTRPGANSLTVADRVTNLRAVPWEMELLYHWNLGAPLLSEGAKLLAPSLEVAPRDARAAQGLDGFESYPAPTPGYGEQVYWHDLAAGEDGRTLAALVASERDKALVLRFAKSELSCFAQWKNTAGEPDGYVTGLEPATNFPNPRPFERRQGRVVTLAPQASYSATTVMEVLDSAEAVAALEKEVAALLAGRKPKIHRQPKPGWSDV